MKKDILTAKNYELLVNLWIERMTSLADQIEDRAERYAPGSRNQLELLAKADGIRASITHLTTLESQFITLHRQEKQTMIYSD